MTILIPGSERTLVDQIVDVERFEDDRDVLGAEVPFQLADPVDGRRADHDGDARRLAVQLQLLEHLPAVVFAADDEVEDDQLRLHPLDVRQVATGVRVEDDLEPLLLEDVPQQLEDLGGVVHHQDAAARSGRSRREDLVVHRRVAPSPGWRRATHRKARHG